MPWTVDYNPMLEIIELVYDGVVTGPDMMEASTRVIALTKEKGTSNVFVDSTDIVFVGSLMDLYSLPETQYVEEKADRGGRLALTLPRYEKYHAAAKFYEDVCRNRGWMVKLFISKQEALNWLTGRDSSDDPGTGQGT